MKKSEEVNEVKVKVLSHRSRMSQPSIPSPYPFCSDYHVRSSEETMENGRLVRRSTYKTVHPQDMFKGLVASDFALENVVNVGAVGSLKESYLGVNSVSELSDRMEGTVDNIIAAVDNYESGLNDGGNE